MLRDKRIAVLGGSRGIGFAVAQGAVREGAEVIIASSQSENVERAISKLPAGVSSGAVVDLKSATSITQFFESLGGFDHLVFTAGEPLPLRTPVIETDLDTARRYFEVRYWGAVTAVKAAQRYLRADGSIVLTSGTAARRPPAGFAFAASICGAIESLTRALALEIAPLRINVVTPGMVATELWSSLSSDVREEVFRTLSERLPVRHIAEPEEIAEAYLSFMRNPYATGQSLVVDGGAVLI